LYEERGGKKGKKGKKKRKKGKKGKKRKKGKKGRKEKRKKGKKEKRKKGKKEKETLCRTESLKNEDPTKIFRLFPFHDWKSKQEKGVVVEVHKTT
jgi:hypothetical protein